MSTKKGFQTLKVFFLCRLSVRDKRKVKSQVKSNTYSPEFNETFELLVHEPQHQSLTAILYDYDLLSAADELGR